MGASPLFDAGRIHMPVMWSPSYGALYEPVMGSVVFQSQPRGGIIAGPMPVRFRPVVPVPGRVTHAGPVQNRLAQVMLPGATVALGNFWMVRMARKGSRELSGNCLDAYLLPWLPGMKKRLMQWAKPKAAYFGKDFLLYTEMYGVFKKHHAPEAIRRVVKSILSVEVYSILECLAVGDIFRGFSKIGLIGITCLQIAYASRKAYKQTQDKQQTMHTALHHLGRWGLGSVVGEMCYDFGVTLSSRRRLLCGFLVGTLGKAVFDYFWIGHSTQKNGGLQQSTL